MTATNITAKLTSVLEINIQDLKRFLPEPLENRRRLTGIDRTGFNTIFHIEPVFYCACMLPSVEAVYVIQLRVVVMYPTLLLLYDALCAAARHAWLHR